MQRNTPNFTPPQEATKMQNFMENYDGGEAVKNARIAVQQFRGTEAAVIQYGLRFLIGIGLLTLIIVDWLPTAVVVWSIISWWVSWLIDWIVVTLNFDPNFNLVDGFAYIIMAIVALFTFLFTLLPTAIEVFLVMFYRQNIRIMGGLILGAIGFDYLTDWKVIAQFVNDMMWLPLQNWFTWGGESFATLIANVLCYGLIIPLIVFVVSIGVQTVLIALIAAERQLEQAKRKSEPSVKLNGVLS